MSGILNYLKRWFEILIIPVFIMYHFEKKDTNKILILLNVMALLFTIFNYDTLINSISTDRLQIIGVNVWGTLMAMLILVVLHCKLKISVKIFFIIVESSILIATSSRGAIFSLLLILILDYLYHWKKVNIKIIAILIFIPICIKLISMLFPYSFMRIFNTIVNGIFNDNSASSRINTGFSVLQLMFSKISLFLFGTGYGNTNMYNATGFYTADNMYINMFAWCGVFALFVYLVILYKILMRITTDKQNDMKSCMFFSTIYLFVAGFEIESLNEPTIGAIFMIILGLYEINSSNNQKIEYENQFNMVGKNSYIINRGNHEKKSKYIK